ncbi:hypothetical protein KC669_04825 [Candidatus Dojkabacteria bacterium]|uniref:Uncharacterized protein n=1 Tax=Candidatus Dojkabacteria bacterium TaxID=2099670 RepID=A0A955LBV2_9BACT|nr:hypothetical protein [Candidatus Dojkabacteria bacterium]
MINPILLCNQHLIGEHGEIHKHRHNFVKGHSIKKRVELNQIEPLSMETRHNELAAEMLRRDMTHQSPYTLPDLSKIPIHHRNYKVNVESAMVELHSRCAKCKHRYDLYIKGELF